MYIRTCDIIPPPAYMFQLVYYKCFRQSVKPIQFNLTLILNKNKNPFLVYERQEIVCFFFLSETNIKEENVRNNYYLLLRK